jgi:hypothetical protein
MEGGMSVGVVRVLGWLVIAHGVSHAVLPLRGSLGPSIAIDDWIPVGLYAIAMIGFVTAGLGMLGLKPLDLAISPLLVLASGLSLVAVVRFADPTLWFGAACDVGLLVVGLWRAYGGWPAPPAHDRRWHYAGVVAGFALLGYVAGTSVLYPWHRTWGSTREELTMSLPGDRPHRDPALETQHAITINAPRADVWPKLLQFAAAHGTVTREIIDSSAHAVVLDDGSTMVLLDAPRAQSRLIIRSTISDRRVPVWLSALNLMTFEWPHFVAERRLLTTIKDLAEQGRARSAALR